MQWANILMNHRAIQPRRRCDREGYTWRMAKSAAQHWLIKSEPGSYSIDDLKRDRRTGWSGIRNHQARNFMRDGMKVGDLVLFYHSGEEPGVAGIARVSKAANADTTALDPRDDHYDARATKDNPIWMMVDVEFVERFPHLVPLAELKKRKDLATMRLLQRGQRLSVMPVEAKHFEVVAKLGRE
jgi:predicted RNA-binding protein with PUA-like domain